MKLSLPLPSLFYLSLVRLSVSLWSSNYTLRRIVSYTDKNCFSETNLNDLVKEIFESAETLPIPILFYSIPCDILAILRCTGQQIYNFVTNHAPLLGYNMASWCVHFCVWTPYGTIDQKRTAELLVRRRLCSIDDETQSGVLIRFKLACSYGLDDGKKLWTRLEPENFHGKDLIIIREREDLVTAFWCCYFERQLQVLTIDGGSETTVYTNVLSRLLEKRGTLPTVKFIWETLTSQQKLENISRFATTCAQHGNPEVLLFLISEMNEESERDFFSSQALDILITFSRWPYQDLGLTLYARIKDSLSPEHFMKFLFTIISYKDYIYERNLMEIWTQKPNATSLFLSMEDHKIIDFFETLLEQEYVKTIKLVFTSLGSKDKMTMLVRISHYVIRIGIPIMFDNDLFDEIHQIHQIHDVDTDDDDTDDVDTDEVDMFRVNPNASGNSKWLFLDRILPLALTEKFDVVKYKTFMKNYSKRPNEDFSSWNSTGRLTLFEILYDHFGDV